VRKYWTLRKRHDPRVDKWSETDHVQELRCPWCDQLFELKLKIYLSFTHDSIYMFDDLTLLFTFE
jgi:hypothetical protein